jgi:NADPH-dependent curcumin reductase CurA
MLTIPILAGALQIVTKRLKMQGFIVGDYAAEIGAEFAKNMAQYVLEGKVVVKEKVFDGIASTGAAFADMMAGGNIGKQVVKVVQEDPFPVKQQ